VVETPISGGEQASHKERCGVHWESSGAGEKETRGAHVSKRRGRKGKKREMYKKICDITEIMKASKGRNGKGRATIACRTGHCRFRTVDKRKEGGWVDVE